MATFPLPVAPAAPGTIPGLRLAEQPAPVVLPLLPSHVADDAEAAVKNAFLVMVAAGLRPVERRVNVLGVPHLGDFTLVERAVKAAGLALVRSDGADAGVADTERLRVLHKAWAGGLNKRRGLRFLSFYLQLLYPGRWHVYRQWQDKAKTYPDGLSDTDGGHHHPTSRLRISVDGDADSGRGLASVAASLRSVVPARFVVLITVERAAASTLGIANGAAVTQTAFRRGVAA